MIPVVLAYCQKARLPLKQFMSILGYSALTGGTNTVIGTSTNLVISGKTLSLVGLHKRLVGLHKRQGPACRLRVPV
jgi:Na+/H+ antiporter NhaD/arsenite permease-like protein